MVEKYRTEILDDTGRSGDTDEEESSSESD